MTTAQRNRKLKSLLATEFGHDKVWVRGDRGTAYGWITVYIETNEPWGAKKRVWDLIKANNIEIGTYGYDDPGSDYGYGSKININLSRPWGA